MEHVKTIDEVVQEAYKIEAEAGKVSTREEHARVWDKKVDLLRIINGAFETGYWVGPNYNKLWEAKNTLFRAERIAGNRSLETYAKR